MTELNEDILRLVFQAAAASIHTSENRDPESPSTLLACCLVCKTWQRPAQAILQRTLVIGSERQLARRLLSRSEDDLKYVREAIFSQQSGRGYFRCDPEPVLKALPTNELVSLAFRLDGTFAPGRDAIDRAAIGTRHHAPPPYPFTFPRLREAVLGNINGGASWTPLLQVTPALQYLEMVGVGWTGHSEYAHTPLYLPLQPPPFSLKHFDLHRSHIRREPLRWLLSRSGQSLQCLSIRFLQRDWDTMADVSELRAERLLPNVTHLDIETNQSNVKSWEKWLSGPLAKWSGIESIYIYGLDNKCRAALIHGISKLDPIPLVELGVGDMRLHEFKGLFRLRKGKLRQGTVLRLLTSPSGNSHAHRGYGPWDYQAKEYWDEMGEEATEIALKAGVTLEISSTSRRL
ncbi:hypothetical protein LTR56_011280 [Elasticomyces elasticus]|nr:hypothetical protein LTR56_011280 [Elasticomyces elasticus]KAK3668353.1 hypothetical protein LTR22_000644 [Elasticomyces elasticus]KAK4911030.1 hypothetical protein LTR49_020391 [Elasticomyces elasticus]KAK5756504.1 hypothetical protein LTS12_013458 [Elasticomyces elasticus]